jgi:photosystem II stability/assembly factor-like uncharacterized protein
MSTLRRCAAPAALAALFAIVLTARVDTANPGQQSPAARTGLAGRIDAPPAEASGAPQPDVASREDLLAAAQRAIIDVRAGRSSRWAVAGDDWIAMGPFGHRDIWNFDPLHFQNGLIASVVAHPTRPDTYVALPGRGGVLQTTDAGASWRWINETLFSSLSATALHPWVFDPHAPSVVYSYENPSGTAGRLLRSDDYGATFRTIWSTPSASTPITALAPDPRPLPSGQTRLLMVAGYTSVELAGDGSGVKYWDSANLHANRLQFNARNPDMVFASGVDLHRSTDGGRTWVSLRLPATGSFSLAVGPGDPATLYIAERPRGSDTSSPILVHRSDNAGDSWSTTASLNDDYYDGRRAIAVHPEDPMTVVVGGSYLRRSTDGGRTFTGVNPSGQPAARNINSAAFDAAGRAVLAGAYGIVRIEGMTYSDLNRGFSALAFTGAELDPAQPSTVYGVLDSNALMAFRGALGWQMVTQYHEGPGMAFEPQKGLLYSVYWQQWWDFISMARCAMAMPWSPIEHSSIRFNTVGPYFPIQDFRATMAAAPWSPSTLYLLSRWLSWSTDQARTWTTFPREFQTNCRSLPGGRHCEANVPSGFLTAVGFSDTSPGTFAVGGSKGHVFWTTSGGAGWTETWLNLPYRPVTDLVLHPRDTQVAWASFGGYNADDPTGKKQPYAAGHVFKTVDGGSVWKDVSGNLPDVPVNTMVVDTDATPATIYVGTDVGVFRLSDGETSWQVFGRGLPTVRIADLALNRQTQTLVAASLGRGMFLISSRFGR